MSDELKKSIEKKRKIAEWIYLGAFYAIVLGIGFMFIGVFQGLGVEKLMTEEYMQDPTIPYNEKDNASFVLTPDNIDAIYKDVQNFLIAGGIILISGVAVAGSLMVVTPSKKERHKLVCPGVVNIAVDLKREKAFSSIEPEYCPMCGLKLSLLDKK